MIDPFRLDTETLILGYANGYFPMPDPESGEIRWFHPDPRAILPLDRFHCSRSLERVIRRGGFRVTINRDFTTVMQMCSERDETWINEEFKRAYGELHKVGFAHSLEIWTHDQLTGGVYGVALGGAFFAESKFHRRTDHSKLALYYLIEHLKIAGFTLLEVQFMTPHLKTLGAEEISAAEYEKLLTTALGITADFAGSGLQQPREIPP